MMSPALLPLRQVWPDDFVERYRAAGYWRGETFPKFLRERAARFGDRTAIVDAQQRWTYAQLLERAETFGSGLCELGLQSGDRVVVQMGNVPEFYGITFGLFLAGLVPVFALPAHRITEISHLVHKSQAAAYIAAQEYDHFDYRTLARQLRAQTPMLQHVVIFGEDAAEFVALRGFKRHLALPPRQEPCPQSVAFLQISGGSTGLPKLIARTHDDYIYSFRASNGICGITKDSRYMVVLPAAHNFPMSSPGALGVLYAGGTVVLSHSTIPENAFELIERERVTDLGLVPPMALLWAEAAQQTGHDLSSLRVLQVGGAKLTTEAARRVVAGFKCQLQQVFGMAEGLVNYTRLDDDEDTIFNTQGRPISAGDEVLVVDDDGNAVPDGHSGYLLTRGPYTIRGYHNDDAANARAFTAEGYFRTGDIVQRSASGYLTVQGRATDHINRGGEKVSAEEVEDHLLAHPQVFDAVVVSIPDGYLGERVCAFIIPRGEMPRLSTLKAWMRERGLAAFKIPDRIACVDAFEITAVGKTSRKELRACMRDMFLRERAATAFTPDLPSL